MPVSSRHTGWFWDEQNSRLDCYVRGVAILRVDDVTADLDLIGPNGIAGLGTAVPVTMNDDALLALGTGDDVVILNRSTSLAAGVELANVIVGTSVLSLIPANSLIVADITADGDLVFVAQTGGNSIEYFRADASALVFIVNEATQNIDFRVESDGNANAIFVDAGNDRVGILNGAPGVALDITGAMTSSGILSTDEWQTTGGGTVTQLTSKDTPFTLNGTTGVITLNNSEVGILTEVSAVWTNSSIDATSVVLVNFAASGPGNPEDYLIFVAGVASGSCTLVVSNQSGGALSAAIQINFVVMGGASS